MVRIRSSMELNSIVEQVVKPEEDISDPVEKVYRTIEKIEENRELNAFVTVDAEGALRKAEEIRRKITSGKRLGVLAGLIVAVKDNISTRGLRTTCSSKMLENYVPVYDATVIEKIRTQDAIVIGKTNMDEFAMGSSTETSFFGPTRNFFDHSRVAGGSSGGSAVAVACGAVDIALGSDTGGSIRNPAAFNSIVGLKPTYGRVSRYGLIAYASSLDQIGPMAKNTLLTALLLQVIAGRDLRDSTTFNKPVPNYVEEALGKVEGIRVGVIKEGFENIDERVSRKVYSALDTLQKIGCIVEEVSMPFMKYALPAYYIIAMAECSSNLARFDGIRYGGKPVKGKWEEQLIKIRTECFGEEVKRRIFLGTFVLSAGYKEDFYIKACRVRRKIYEEFKVLFKNYNVLATPTMPVLPWKIGELLSPLEVYMMDIETVAVNLAGLPAISIPAGFSDSLPVGLQLIGDHFDETTLLKISYAYEKETGFTKWF
ncbi:MAG: Asp-tRNA(Asn)/Glu-tRNA(Gln) amidotransferase subunit GatA [Crenarchaeota archaeon]|nr:Asp-tRNA(Asn)/Glu-tRNA(Gln) amidotransferase subunit GatA [Thermoproteota archaeon]MDW8033382.1 Asp-tRNA(Asn)/Glu-tRNA(Gln) amidotransferase subunit GatA [Nitrososphaerota archaeon]